MRSGTDAGQIDQGAIPSPSGHDDPIENTTPGTPRPMDKPEHQYTANEAHPSMDRNTPGAPPMDNPGTYAKG